MTNRILRLKKIACVAGIVLLMAGSANADLVYQTDFTTSYTSDNGALVLGGAAPDVVAEEWFGSGNLVSIDDDLTLGNTAANRTRGAAVWLDTTGWATGLVTVEVDVADFTSGSAGAEIFFQAYAATGVDATNSVSMDLHAGFSAGIETAITGSATIATLGSEQTITGDGTDVPFTFNFNGTDQFVALVFSHSTPTGATAVGTTANLDDLTVNTFMAVPEPSSLALLVAGMGFIGLRRRRLK